MHHLGWSGLPPPARVSTVQHLMNSLSAALPVAGPVQRRMDSLHAAQFAQVQGQIFPKLCLWLPFWIWPETSEQPDLPCWTFAATQMCQRLIKITEILAVLLWFRALRVAQVFQMVAVYPCYWIGFNLLLGLFIRAIWRLPAQLSARDSGRSLGLRSNSWLFIVEDLRKLHYVESEAASASTSPSAADIDSHEFAERSTVHGEESDVVISREKLHMSLGIFWPSPRRCVD